MNARWLYFDIPYSKGSNIMRALFGYTSRDGNLLTEVFHPCKDIPTAIQKMEEVCREKNIAISKDLVYVYPLDIRHGLAGIVRELADKHERDFSRQIPKRHYPLPEQLLLYAPFDDGSDEKNLDQAGAKSRVEELEEEAAEESSYGDMLPVLTALRHALRLAVTHLGWNHPVTAHVVANMVIACRRTGNEDNSYESHFITRQLICAMRVTGSKSNWLGKEGLPAEIARLLDECGQGPLGAELLGVFATMK